MISSCPNYLHADVSDGEDLSCHQQEVTGQESCARYSRLRCDIAVSPLLPPSFTYGEGVLLGRQLRALCLETELEKKKKRKGAFVLVSCSPCQGGQSKARD